MKQKTHKHPVGKKRVGHAKKSKRNRALVLMLSLVLVFSMIAGGTIAYLITNGGKVTNTFAPGKVACSVDSQGQITVTQDSNVNAYVRAAVTVNWVDADGKIYAIAPTYKIDAAEGWNVGESDDYFYYPTPVSPNTTLSVPATVSNVSKNPDSSKYSLQIVYIAEAIQAEGVKDGTNTPAYQNAWYGTE